ncbi:methionyl-tRNA formyltransferase [Parvularcula bermudensis HTCC2503]|uniref:Methionyl-tRNA formyltransferase n=1 Tax=Parvularcula bermudensis (strain ATCC BAA-594 / HTCC2503 / KCTC 12087) TaxID=314260 RepID=E0TFR3_PARBH|nr:methionyl-tRNA formyltransferase [Parvularcula bermudensis]ADM09078.1 methionyl-tRNA formyltransferase [Parvularcula bermudensis HTCC2503]
MRIVFMGTPAFAVPALASLLAAGHEVIAVYSQPPRKSGRGHRVQKTPVHQFAEPHGIEVRTPDRLKGPTETQRFVDLNADLGIVVAYGLILPTAFLEAPRHGCLNLHASLLPRWRGAAPVQRAIMAGDAMTGVQVMQMEKGLDTGPILLSETVPIGADQTAGQLTDILAQTGAELLPRALAALDRGGLQATPQSKSGVTYAEKISAAEAAVDWSGSARVLDRHIRGLSPFPGAWVMVHRGGEPIRLKLLDSRLVEGEGADGGAVGAAPGTILPAPEDRVRVATGQGALDLLLLQRPGKAPQDAAAFRRGFALAPGDRLA